MERPKCSSGYADQQLQLVLDAHKMERMQRGGSQEDVAEKIWQDYVAPSGKQLGSRSVVDQVCQEATDTLEAMALDSFPRFAQTKAANKIIALL